MTFKEFKNILKKDFITPIELNSGEYAPRCNGVYLFVYCLDDEDFQILYVGSSKNLRQRMCSATYYRIKREHIFVRSFFIPENDHFELEKIIIKKLQPKYNINSK